MEHHCGYDLMPDQQYATCKCGNTMTNPYYAVGMDPITRMAHKTLEEYQADVRKQFAKEKKIERRHDLFQLVILATGLALVLIIAVKGMM